MGEMSQGWWRKKAGPNYVYTIIKWGSEKENLSNRQKYLEVVSSVRDEHPGPVKNSYSVNSRSTNNPIQKMGEGFE